MSDNVAAGEVELSRCNRSCGGAYKLMQPVCIGAFSGDSRNQIPQVCIAQTVQIVTPKARSSSAATAGTPLMVELSFVRIGQAHRVHPGQKAQRTAGFRH